jgi:hypothetical protein
MFRLIGPFAGSFQKNIRPRLCRTYNCDHIDWYLILVPYMIFPYALHVEQYREIMGNAARNNK